MQTIDWVTTAIAVIALAISAWSFFHDRNRQKTRDEFERRSTQEAAEIQRQLLEIEETRHRWEQEQRNAEESTQRRTDEEARTAAFTVRFGYRDSTRTWARIIATNNGPADARDVELEVFAEKGGRRVDIEPIRGEDYLTAERLQPNESVHFGVAFSLAFPSAADLRYRITWMDGRGSQAMEGRVPVH